MFEIVSQDESDLMPSVKRMSFIIKQDVYLQIQNLHFTPQLLDALLVVRLRVPGTIVTNEGSTNIRFYLEDLFYRKDKRVS